MTFVASENPMPPDNPNPARIQNLDSLRGVAALSVLLYHYTQRFGDIFPDLPKPAISLSRGFFGVHLFFVISGFVIALTLTKTGHVFNFIRNRFFRLYPTYWVALVITFTLVTFWPLPDRVRNFHELLVNVTMIQHWLDVKHIDGVYWTLSLELAFYVWMAVLLSLRLLTEEKGKYVLVGWMLLIVGYFQFGDPKFVYDSTILENILLLRYGHLFFAGMALYFWHQNRKSPIWKIVILCLGLVVQYQTFQWEGVLILLAIYSVFLGVVIRPLVPLTFKPLLWLGTISYSLYLCHQYVGYILLRYGYTVLHLRPAVNISLTISLCVGLAALLHYLVEQPAVNLGKRLSKQVRSISFSVPANRGAGVRVAGARFGDA